MVRPTCCRRALRRRAPAASHRFRPGARRGSSRAFPRAAGRPRRIASNPRLSEPVAKCVVHGDDRCDARLAEQQSHFAEIGRRVEGGELDARRPCRASRMISTCPRASSTANRRARPPRNSFRPAHKRRRQFTRERRALRVGERCEQIHRAKRGNAGARSRAARSRALVVAHFDDAARKRDHEALAHQRRIDVGANVRVGDPVLAGVGRSYATSYSMPLSRNATQPTTGAVLAHERDLRVRQLLFDLRDHPRRRVVELHFERHVARHAVRSSPRRATTVKRFFITENSVSRSFRW